MSKYGFLLVVTVSFVTLGCTDWSEECEAAYSADDYESALRSCAKAAEQGDASAQTNLGRMYNIAEAVTEDYAKAVEWYTKAAEQGNTEAAHRLGVLYDYGEGVPEDNAKAVVWLTQAAERGDVDAQFNVGTKHRDGEGVSVNYVLAHAWLSLAAAQGAEYYIENRSDLEIKMSKEQIAEAQELASEWDKEIKARNGTD